MKNQKLSINLKGKPSGANTLILAVCSLGYSKKQTMEGKDMSDAQYQKHVNKAFVAGGNYSTTSLVTKYKQVFVSTGVSIPGKFWKMKTKKEKAKIIGLPNAKELNGKLKMFSDNIQRLFDSLKDAGKEVEPAMFKEYIAKHILGNGSSTTVKEFNFKEVNKQILFSDFMKMEIEHEEQLLDKGNKSLTQYETLIPILEAYNKDKHPMFVDEIDEMMVEKFFIYLKTESQFVKNGSKARDAKQYEISSLNNKKKAFKKYLRLAIKREKSNLNYDKVKEMAVLSKKKVPKKEVVYLTVEEIYSLHKTDLSLLDEKAEAVLDYFTIAAFSGGKRYSDYHKFELKKNTVNKRYYLYDNSKKTTTPTKVSAFKIVVGIFQKYKNQLPKLPDNSRFNVILQSIVTAAKIDKQVGSHCARRSFASNMIYHYKLDAMTVKELGGWEDLKMMFNYIGKDIEDAYVKMDKMLIEIDE